MAQMELELYKNIIELTEKQHGIDLKKLWAMAVKKYKILHPQASVNRMCRLFGKSKQA
jgi:hypothetical protein